MDPMGLFTNKTQNRPGEMIHPNKKHPQDFASFPIHFFTGSFFANRTAPGSQRSEQVGFSKESQRPMTDAEVASTRVLKLKLEDLLNVFLQFFVVEDLLPKVSQSFLKSLEFRY